jgi:Base plate wedge protein 53
LAEYFVNLGFESTERMDMARFMAFTDNYDPLTSSLLTDIKSLPDSGTYTVQGEDGRPDLLSYRVYGDPQYWWVLLMFNRQLEFKGFVTGDTIRYPSLDSLEDLIFSLRSKASAAGQ